MKAKENQSDVQKKEEQQAREQKKSRKQTEKEQMEAIQNVRSYGIASQKRRPNIKRILFIVGTLLVLVLVSLGVWRFLQGSYKDPIRAQVQIVNERESDLSVCLDASVGKILVFL